jgi:transposase-like protein
MDAYKNAPLTPKGREVMVRSVIDGGHSKAAVVRQFNVAPKIVAKWVARFRTEGVDGLRASTWITSLASGFHRNGAARLGERLDATPVCDGP